jgi:hypothetical protein
MTPTLGFINAEQKLCHYGQELKCACVDYTLRRLRKSELSIRGLVSSFNPLDLRCASVSGSDASCVQSCDLDEPLCKGGHGEGTECWKYL